MPTSNEGIFFGIYLVVLFISLLVGSYCLFVGPNNPLTVVEEITISLDNN